MPSKTESLPDLNSIALAAAGTQGDATPPAGPKGYQTTPRQVICGDIDMRIDRNGTWHYLGSPIGRQALVNLFATVLRRDEAGDYWLITPAEVARIRVEDAPYLAVHMDIAGDDRNQVVSFRTNIDQNVTVSADRPLRVETDPETGEPGPYVTLANDGTEAKVARAIFYDLVERGVEEQVGHEKVFGVWSSGDFFPIGSLGEDGAGGGAAA